MKFFRFMLDGIMFWFAALNGEYSDASGLRAHPKLCIIFGVIQWILIINTFILLTIFALKWWLSLICVICSYIVILIVGSIIEFVVKKIQH